MKDPYKILGVAPTATDAEIKKAYYELAKKYHPDNYADTNLSEVASEKMKEINEAYDVIKEQRANGGKSSNSNYSGYSGAGFSENGTTAEFSRVRNLINQNRINEAEAILNSVPTGSRTAEWSFLVGAVLIKRGRYFDAKTYITNACSMDPNNAEYRETLQRLTQATDNYGGYRQTSTAGGCCDICSTMLCINCLCNSCGGDMIRCC